MTQLTNRSNTKFLLAICSIFTSFISAAFDLDITSVRATLSRPDTSHSLIFNPDNDSKTAFNLTPINNERLGFFVDVNGIEIGYAVDVLANDIETKTQNLLFSYRKLKDAKITLNYQILEGLDTETERVSDGLTNQRFLKDTKSTKLELFGQHNLYTFAGKESLFEHFFLNRPHLSSRFDYSVSIVGGWSIKRLSLENPESIVFNAPFLNEPVPDVSRLNSTSISANVGPLLSLSFKNNINAFVEYKYGVGHIRSSNKDTGLKQSGDEKSSAFGAGVSWTSQDQKTLVLLRAWEQEGRHIKTAFGDLSLVRFF
jgi:hypothetical protein